MRADKNYEIGGSELTFLSVFMGVFAIVFQGPSKTLKMWLHCIGAPIA